MYFNIVLNDFFYSAKFLCLHIGKMRAKVEYIDLFSIIVISESFCLFDVEVSKSLHNLQGICSDDPDILRTL